MTHAVVVGGTGMLRGVSLALAAQGHAVSVIARNGRRLRKLCDEAERGGGLIDAVCVDYRDGPALDVALRGALAEHGPVDVAVAWIHSTAPRAALEVARALTPRRFVHVLGSAAADPSAPDSGRRERFESVSGLTYQEVILGFVVESARSRWLTDAEIAGGVLRAVERGDPRSIVGTVEPWSMRP